MPGGLIGVDWGGSSLRVFRFDANGRVVARRSSHRGVSTIAERRFAEALGELIADWAAEGSAPLMMCGMVGSRQGWAEAAYIPCPSDLDALASNLLPLQTPLGAALIVPGLRVDERGRLDVMRGEETQCLGALPDPSWSGVILHPGTHAKWASFERGRMITFRTWMTGELFDLLRHRSVLSLLMADGDHDDAAFDQGVARGLADPAITSLLFTARTEGLFERMSPVALSSYLSGLLIGSEVMGGLTQTPEGSLILLVGDAKLTTLYARALELAGRPASATVDGESAVTVGLWRLHRSTARELVA